MVVTAGNMEMMKVGVDELVTWWLDRKRSCLKVTIFSLSRNVICSAWEVGT